MATMLLLLVWGVAQASFLGTSLGVDLGTTPRNTWSETLSALTRMASDFADEGKVEVTSVGKFTLTKHLGATQTFNAFAGVSDEQQPLLIKYMHNCFMGETRLTHHPAVAEFAFTKVAASANLASMPLFLSAPSACPSHPSEKISFKNWYPFQSYRQCSEAGGTVRTMILPATGPSISDVFTKRNPPRTIGSIMNFGIQLINAVKSLHQLGIVHGDIHRQSVVFKLPNKDRYLLGEDEIVLADFVIAKYFPEEMNKPEPVSGEIDGLALVVLSPWELTHKRRSRRDDVYHLIETVADLVSGLEWIDSLSDLHMSEDGTARVKGMGQAFLRRPYYGHSADYRPFSPDPYTAFNDLSQERVGSAESHLTAILSEVLRLQIDQEPPYQRIIDTFNSVKALTTSP